MGAGLKRAFAAAKATRQPIPKPEPLKRVKARRQRQQSAADRLVYAAVTARDGNLCRVCGSQQFVERHHLKGRKFTTTQDVCCLCDDCHGLIHPRIGGKRLKVEGNADEVNGLRVSRMDPWGKVGWIAVGWA